MAKWARTPKQRTQTSEQRRPLLHRIALSLETCGKSLVVCGLACVLLLLSCRLGLLLLLCLRLLLLCFGLLLCLFSLAPPTYRSRRRADGGTLARIARYGSDRRSRRRAARCPLCSRSFGRVRRWRL